MGKQAVFRYVGAQGDVLWNGDVCIHAGECSRAKGDLFISGREPWCQPDLASSEEALIQVIRRCPSGALSYEKAGVTVAERAEPENRIAVANNGPLYATGELVIDGRGDDMPSVAFRAALCRCGASKNKPFCDNSHEQIAFIDHGAVGEEGVALASKGGPLRIERAPNGPLLIQGNLSIVAASGRVAWTGTKTALCRCGQSKNKPFCDGSHKTAGFQAE